MSQQTRDLLDEAIRQAYDIRGAVNKAEWKHEGETRQLLANLHEALVDLTGKLEMASMSLVEPKTLPWITRGMND